ncbi:polyprenyl synthetase family protein [Falsiruegeria mediterranea]|uniref:Geranylgeranyl diphosphate synthase n=1 Tax=Falsiruegeria mediterranea M17 TaxID=1200281 RepID=A0A2R8C3F2_9RHOB|nr:polyprenyl synthetase family protein [Falsiruegeria mediterranea]SPJ26958.1 Farnesyl diphosphate synthase [Falsiruegeria mediterranea M17]
MFREQLARDAARIQNQFDLVLGGLDDLDVTQAMAYTTQGGKRLRGFLVLESARLHDVAEDQAIWPATGIEALHAYSLVHDDLPCMDDDDLRRGKPTIHMKWDQATAVLAGDALQTLAFELCTRPEVGVAEVRAGLALTLAQASGAQGMVLGQALDIAAESAAEPLNLDEITRLQAGKTGALIEWSACAGARLAQADTTPLRQYAQALGLAFQIADDILDVEGDAQKAGKRLQKDADAGKATFVSLLGLDAAKLRAADLIEQGCAALETYGSRADTLKEAARFVIARDS